MIQYKIMIVMMYHVVIIKLGTFGSSRQTTKASQCFHKHHKEVNVFVIMHYYIQPEVFI